MKRIVTSLGIAALGAACVQSANAQGVGGDASKSWSVSVALRGFYDDNVNTANGGTNKVDTFGFEVTPSLGYQLPLDQTTLSLAYTYSYVYYDKRPLLSTDQADQTHTIAARLLHAFDERTTLSVGDSFVIGQEPDVLRAGNFTAAFQRISGNNLRNYGNITVNHQFTPKFGIEAGYANALSDYEEGFADVQAALAHPKPPQVALPVVSYDAAGHPLRVNGVSRSAALDRMEHTAHVDARWTLQSSTIALIGYSFGITKYIANEPTQIITPAGGNNPTNVLLYSWSRDSQAHYGYVGVEHSFRSDLSVSAKVGARLNDLVNSPLHESSITPYATASLRYNYARDCNLEAGISHDRSASDVLSSSASSITSDSESTTVYASVTHRILPELFGTLMGQYQNSAHIGGSLDGTSDQYYLMSASLEYRINRHVSANLSYHYDLLGETSLLGRGYDRNRIYVGATVTY